MTAEAAQNESISRQWWNLVRALSLYRQISPWRSAALLAVVLPAALVPALQVVLVAEVVQGVSDGASGAGVASSVVWSAVLLAGASVAGHVLSSVDQYLRAVLRFDFTTFVGEKLLEKGTRLDLEQFERSENYDKLQRALREGGARAYETFTALVDAFRDGLQLMSVAAVLFVWSPWLSLLIIASPFPLIIANVRYGSDLYRLEYGRTQERRRAFYYQYLCTTDSSFKEVRLFGLEQHLARLYRTLLQRFRRQDVTLARKQALTSGIGGMLTVMVSSGAVLFAAINALQTGAVGELAGYLTAIGSVQVAATGLFLGLAAMHQANLFLGNLFDFLEIPEGLIATGERRFPEKLQQGIRFDRVSFKYPGTDQWVLQDVSFTMRAGETLAVVGHNGAGKTTLVKLLCRLYEPTSGHISIDGVPLEALDVDDLRANMAVIFQDYVKYEETLRTNVAWGDIQRPPQDDRIMRAIEGAGATQVVDRLERGLDSMLGRHFATGEQLSVGQWQRVALARALARKAQLLVLDEPTAAMDAVAESELFERMAHVASGSTCLLVAHRFSTVRMADRIVVFEGGRVVGQGSHAELMGEGGLYAELFTLQASGYQ